MAEADDERAAGAVPEDSEFDHDELVGRLHSLFNPEPDEDGFMREWPDSRLEKHHGLNFDYMKTHQWEGSTMHPNTRHFSDEHREVISLTRNMDVFISLFGASLRLYGDSLVEYHQIKENPSVLRYYLPSFLHSGAPLNHSSGIHPNSCYSRRRAYLKKSPTISESRWLRLMEEVI